MNNNSPKTGYRLTQNLKQFNRPTKEISQQNPEQWCQEIAQASLSQAKGLSNAIAQQKQWSQAIAKAKLSKA